MRGRAGRARAVVWLVIAACLVVVSAAVAKDHGSPTAAKHGPDRVPPGHQPGGPHGNKPGHGDQEPAAPASEPSQPAPPPASSPAAPAPPAKPTARRRPNSSHDGRARQRSRSRSSDGAVHKAIRALVPLEELAAGAPAAQGSDGGGADTRASSGAAVNGAAPHTRNASDSSKTAGNDGGAGGGGGTSGPLPFTGLALVTLVLTGLALIAGGHRLRRRVESEPSPVAPMPVPAASPAALRPEPGPIGVRSGRSVLALALVGLLGLTLIAAARRPAASA